MLTIELMLGCVNYLSQYFRDQIKTEEYQLSRKLFKCLPFKLKIQYLWKFYSLYKPVDEFDFFTKHLSSDIINLTRKSVIDELYCKRVVELAKPYLLVSHIQTREEADKILQQLNQIKDERMESLRSFLNEGQIGV